MWWFGLHNIQVKNCSWAVKRTWERGTRYENTRGDMKHSHQAQTWSKCWTSLLNGRLWPTLESWHHARSCCNFGSVARMRWWSCFDAASSHIVFLFQCCWIGFVCASHRFVDFVCACQPGSIMSSVFWRWRIAAEYVERGGKKEEHYTIWSRKLASASWSPSCFSKVLGGWNLESRETSQLTTLPLLSQAVWSWAQPLPGHGQ